MGDCLPYTADSKVKFPALPTSWRPPGTDRLPLRGPCELSHMALCHSTRNIMKINWTKAAHRTCKHPSMVSIQCTHRHFIGQQLTAATDNRVPFRHFITRAVVHVSSTVINLIGLNGRRIHMYTLSRDYGLSTGPTESLNL